MTSILITIILFLPLPYQSLSGTIVKRTNHNSDKNFKYKNMEKKQNMRLKHQRKDNILFHKYNMTDTRIRISWFYQGNHSTNVIVLCTREIRIEKPSQQLEIQQQCIHLGQSEPYTSYIFSMKLTTNFHVVMKLQDRGLVFMLGTRNPGLYIQFNCLELQ